MPDPQRKMATGVALLELDDLRVDADGVPVVDGLVASSGAASLVVVGAARALFEAVAAMRPVLRGTVRVQGVDVSSAVERGLLAGAPLDPALNLRWTPNDYATWSARLVGASRAHARTSAGEALGRFGLQAVATTPFRALPVHARRMAVVAAAAATGAEVIALEDPWEGIPDEVMRPAAEAMLRGLAGRSWILFAGRAPLGGAFSAAAAEVVILRGSRVIAQGGLATLAQQEGRFALRVEGDVEAFVVQVREGGARIDAHGADAFTVQLGGTCARTLDLFRAAAAAGARIVELVPTSFDFS